ncbi:hypothetical protein A3B32_02490 [Candidatus Uhrbacteria bacterium RIFCSPLOWO2_01_FULL_53_9]|uniref:Glycosyltransferase subfamily 4-like N-terminal domain-containing protein n=3 Tax=Candidatus Uhriibacteriota TaxID=1752732 RepID=A0A1F7UX14_9BACT|nr:MAG: hypothetical protein A3C17_04075 [Candidatus Uhrbacteria bacterium RIFCSPHIGHO2_02_FULL_53_13]OGL82815.1 MAG: hypothetical protein A3B32_02490 [Candidatus Uhrbacteria bacterium RIFCSPLOWO2_01_FULL_53_9]OGL89500.1 MAG: hypothetical protein A3I45_03250 [Candidatus Uhrbacteria bacterium RIFCSPLOWO2_02_FULL_53_10]
MNIAFLGQKSFDVGQQGGGIEKHVHELAPRLVRAGHHVLLYVRPHDLATRPRYWEGVRLVYLPTVYTKHLEAIIHVFLSTLDVLFRPVDVIHYHGVGPALLSWVPRLLKRHATVVVTFHAQDRLHQKWGSVARAVLHAGEWAACHVPHMTIAVSHGIQVLCRETYHTEAVFIPNGAEVATVRTTSLIKRDGLKPNAYILFVGRLLPVKGVHHLIRAFRRVKTDKQLIIIGAPAVNEEPYVAALKRDAEGDARIRFLGFRPPEDLAEFYAHAYLYCQPSESEGLPLSVIEAMGFGTAVLVSDIPGNVEAIHHAGFTFANKDADDLVLQLQHLIDHPEQVAHSAKAVKDTVRTFFHWDRITEHTIEVYRSARH